MDRQLTEPAMMAAYASGCASPGVSLLVAARLAQRPAECTHVTGMECLGGALLQEIEAAPMAATALDAVFSEIETADPEPAAAPESGPLPGPVGWSEWKTLAMLSSVPRRERIACP